MIKHKIGFELESDAILAILSKCEVGKWQLVSSEVLDIEIEKTPDVWRKNKVYELSKLSKEHITLNKSIIERAHDIQMFGIKPFDSLHLALAEFSKVDAFLSTDKKLLQAAIRLNTEIIVANPLNWFMEVEDE